jgi:hypothetical protein
MTCLEDTSDLIAWHRARRNTEMHCFTLQEGCHVEPLTLGCIEQVLMLVLSIASRIMQRMPLWRTLPDLGAELLHDPTSSRLPTS